MNHRSRERKILGEEIEMKKEYVLESIQTHSKQFFPSKTILTVRTDLSSQAGIYPARMDLSTTKEEDSSFNPYTDFST